MSEIEKPTSGSHLAQMLDVEYDEGVVVAVFPETIDEITTKEVPYTDDSGEYMHVALVKCGTWGQRAMDVLVPDDSKMKWWRAKAIMQAEKLDMVPVRWEGPISEIPQQYFDGDYVLGIRFYDAGPWFFPKEQLKTEEQANLEKAIESLAESRLGADAPVGG